MSGKFEEQDVGPSSGSSSSWSERMTIAYSETPAIGDDFEYTSSSSSRSRLRSKSTSLDTPRSESFTSLFDDIKQEKNQAEFFGYEPRRSMASLHDGPQLDGLEYLWSNNIFQLFCFLMSHLLAHCPDEPVAFLARLLDRCLLYRDRAAQPPLLFDEPHVRSVYTALDPGGDGRIRYAQYVTGMKTLGLTEFNLLPGEVENFGKDVEKELFISEARQALLHQLDSILGCRPAEIPKEYRDSRGEAEGSSGTEREDAAKDRPSEVLMAEFKQAQQQTGGMPGLMSSHTFAGASVLSSKDLVTRYMREKREDKPGFVSSHAFVSEGDHAELKTESVECQAEHSGDKGTFIHSIGYSQMSVRKSVGAARTSDNLP